MNNMDIIKNDLKEIVLSETEYYFIYNTYFAKLNKNNSLIEYEHEVAKGDYNLEDIKITKEIYFSDVKPFNLFKNSLLTDFDFISGSGGCDTDDSRINTEEDYYAMSDEEKESVTFYRLGIAVFLNNEIKFVVDPQGYSYARYVGLIGPATRVDDKNYLIRQIE